MQTEQKQQPQQTKTRQKEVERKNLDVDKKKNYCFLFCCCYVEDGACVWIFEPISNNIFPFFRKCNNNRDCVRCFASSSFSFCFDSDGCVFLTLLWLILTYILFLTSCTDSLKVSKVYQFRFLCALFFHFENYIPWMSFWAVAFKQSSAYDEP